MPSWWRHPIRNIKKFLEDMKDQKLNRETVGRDKYGNKYYQYYSPYGLPTKRQVIRNTIHEIIIKRFRLSL